MRKTAVAVVALLFLGACGDEAPKQKKVSEAQKAQRAAESITFTDNAEIENIKKRLELTSNPGLLGYIALINRVGQVVLYTPVSGKVTSGAKRLTPQSKLWGVDRGQYNGSAIGPAPSDEGTWGSSNPYVYFWTPGGQYIQTSMEYVYSDKPFRLNEEPLMVVADTPTTESATIKAEGTSE